MDNTPTFYLSLANKKGQKLAKQYTNKQLLTLPELEPLRLELYQAAVKIIHDEELIEKETLTYNGEQINLAMNDYQHLIDNLQVAENELYQLSLNELQQIVVLELIKKMLARYQTRYAIENQKQIEQILFN